MAQQLIPDFRDIKDSESLARIEQYLAKLQRQLKYQFAHIDEGNIQDGAITEKKLTEALSRKIADTYGNSSEFSQTASKIKMQVENLQLGASSFEMTVGGIETRVSNVEGDVSTLEQTANHIKTRVFNAEGSITELEQAATNIILAASSDKVYRAATEPALLNQLAALDPPVAMAVGLLWLDTTTMLIKRCSVVSPLTWVVVQANEVHTSYIDIQDDSIDIKSTGTINIGANAKLVLSSADRLETTAGTSLTSYVSSAANGRSKVYNTTWAARPTTGVQVGDLLIQSDSTPANKLYRWNGAGWVDARDGAATLAEQTDTQFKWIVSGGTSAATMVLTEDFYGVVADHINLSANNSIKLAVSGGTNLRPESTPMSAWGLTVTQTGDNYGLYKGTKSWAVSNKVGTSPYVRLSYGMSFRAGVTYTASFYGYLSAIDNVWNLIYYDGAHPPTSQTAWTRKSLDLGYYRYSFSFTPSWTGNGGEGVLAYADNLSAGQSFWISGIQIEEGTMATDWSPSPSDPASGVKAAGIEIGPGIMRQYADLDWSMTAGSGASEIGMANNRADGLFVWGGGSPANAKFKAMMSGDVYAKNFYLADSTLANAVPHVMTIPRVITHDTNGTHAIHIPIIADFIGIESVKFFIPYIYAYRYYNFSTGSGAVISPTGAFTSSTVDGDTAVSQSYIAGGGPYDITSRLTKTSGKITRNTHTMSLSASGAMNTLVIVYIKGYISAPGGTLY